MFDIDQFVEDCKGKRASAVREVLEKALRDPEGVKQAFKNIKGFCRKAKPLKTFTSLLKLIKNGSWLYEAHAGDQNLLKVIKPFKNSQSRV